jgi:hypothetical protein
MVPITGMSFGKQVSSNHWLEPRIAKKEIEPGLQFLKNAHFRCF